MIRVFNVHPTTYYVLLPPSGGVYPMRQRRRFGMASCLLGRYAFHPNRFSVNFPLVGERFVDTLGRIFSGTRVCVKCVCMDHWMHTGFGRVAAPPSTSSASREKPLRGTLETSKATRNHYYTLLTHFNLGALPSSAKVHQKLHCRLS